MQHSNLDLSKIEDTTLIGKHFAKLNSPIMVEDDIFCVSENGDILKFNIHQPNEPEVLFTILGQPSSIYYNEIEQSFLVADFAHQSVFERVQNQTQEIHNLITDYNEKAFLGPNSIKIGPFSKSMFFSDSGPFQQSSIESKDGSLFCYKADTQVLKCLSYRNLAYPAGIEIQEDEKFLLLCEMGENRILKFVLEESCAGNSSVFYQFSGRFGPSAISAFSEIFYVSLFEFEELSDHGVIAVLNMNGQMIQKYNLPVGPEIIGISASTNLNLTSNDSLFICEGKNLHQVKLKTESDSKLDDSIVVSKKM